MSDATAPDRWLRPGSTTPDLAPKTGACAALEGSAPIGRATYAGLSIRLRLTLWYTAVMAVTLVGASVALYVVLAFNVLTPSRDQLLATRANGLASALSLRAAAATPGTEQRRTFLPQYVNSLAEGDMSIVVRGADWRTSERSANLGEVELPLSEATLNAARAGRSTYEDVAIQNVRLRLFSAPVVANGQTVGLVQVARPTRDVEETLDSLRDALLVGNSVLVVLGGLAGWFLAGRSLEPVRRITRTAEEIESSGELDRRVFYRGPRDDLGELAVAVNNMLGRLEASFNAQRRFVADASHELRTPLTTLRVNLEVLRKQREAAPPSWGEVLDDLALELERLTRLVEGLLELARADGGRHLELMPLELDPLLERVERQVGQIGSGVAVALTGPPVGTVQGSADALTQLLLILLDNAIKYTPPGGKISIERARRGRSIEIRVVDTGPGIAPEALPHIFDRFYRAPSARGRSGTGLGLAIARWIAQEHHGRLDVRTALGRGSAFIVTLPSGAA